MVRGHALTTVTRELADLVVNFHRLRCGAGYSLRAEWAATDLESFPHCVENTALALAFAVVREHEPCQARQAAR